MLLRRVWCATGCGLALLGCLYAFQRPFREFPAVEYNNFPLPADWNEKTEWVFARLMFPGGPLDGYRGRFDGDFRLGLSLWTQDYPRADRHFVQAIRRLTRIHVRSVEQPVLLEDGDAYDWPWLYAVQAGEWGLTQDEGRRLREYCLRGGFFFADDFHGPDEWAEFEKRIRFAFPDRPIVDIDDADAIFRTGRRRLHHASQRPFRDSRCRTPPGGFKEWRARRPLGGNLRRQGPHHGGCQFQPGYGRFLGVGRFPRLSRQILRSGDPPRRELCHVRDDALREGRSTTVSEITVPTDR